MTDPEDDALNELRQYISLNAATGIVAALLFQGLIDSLHAKGVMADEDLKLLAEDLLDVAERKLRDSFRDLPDRQVEALTAHARRILCELFEPFEVIAAPHH